MTIALSEDSDELDYARILVKGFVVRPKEKKKIFGYPDAVCRYPELCVITMRINMQIDV